MGNGENLTPQDLNLHPLADSQRANHYTCAKQNRKEVKKMKKITLVSTAMLAGFEPAYTAVKVLCLTAWQ